MCASSCAMIASTCDGDNEASAATGSRIAGRSQPTTVGTSTSVDSTTAPAAGKPGRIRNGPEGGLPAARRRCDRQTVQAAPLPPPAGHADEQQYDAGEPCDRDRRQQPVDAEPDIVRAGIGRR